MNRLSVKFDGVEDAHFGESDGSSIPGISELRTLDENITHLPFWVLTTRNDQDTSNSEGAPGHGPSRLIRFGSTVERWLHLWMRVLAMVDLLWSCWVAGFDVVYPLKRTPIVFLIDGTIVAAFALGLAARFRTSIINVHNCEECTDLQMIRKSLLGSWQVRLDIVSLAASPFLYMRWPLAPLFFLRNLKCWRLPRSTRRVILLGHIDANPFREFASVAVGIFAATHLIACLWFQAKVYSRPGHGHEWSAWNGWSIDVFHLDDADAGALSLPLEFGDSGDLFWCYARSFRDGAYMLISWAGPNAMSRLELIVISFLAPVSGLIMAYVYASFVQTLEQTMTLEIRFAERMSVLSAACEHMVLPKEFSARICRYYSFLSMHQMTPDTREMLSSLSGNLMMEIRMFRMRQVLRSASFFDGLSQRVILQLVQTFEEIAFGPGDMICRKGELADCMYMLLSGEVAVLVDDAATVKVATLGANDYFGELCFLKDRFARTAWIRAETFCAMWSFDKDNFNILRMSNVEAREQIYKAIIKRLKDFKDISPEIREEMKEFLPGGRKSSTPGLREANSDLGRLPNASHDDDEVDENERTPLMSSERSRVPSQPAYNSEAKSVTSEGQGRYQSEKSNKSTFLEPTFALNSSTSRTQRRKSLCFDVGPEVSVQPEITVAAVQAAVKGANNSQELSAITSQLQDMHAKMDRLFRIVHAQEASSENISTQTTITQHQVDKMSDQLNKMDLFLQMHLNSHSSTPETGDQRQGTSKPRRVGQVFNSGSDVLDTQSGCVSGSSGSAAPAANAGVETTPEVAQQGPEFTAPELTFNSL